MKTKEFSKMSADELAKKVGELREELFNLKMQGITGSLENSAKIRSVRRDIARVFTVLNTPKKA